MKSYKKLNKNKALTFFRKNLKETKEHNMIVDMEKRIDPTLFFGTPKDYTVTFPNGCLQKSGRSSIESNAFVIDGVNNAFPIGFKPSEMSPMPFVCLCLDQPY